MSRTVLRIAIGIALWFGWAISAQATTCPAYTYTFSNGTTADATQVNSNFTTIMNCANTDLAPLASPTFSGHVSIGTTGSAPLEVTGASGTGQVSVAKLDNSTNGGYTTLLAAGSASTIGTWTDGSEIVEFVPYSSSGSGIIDSYVGSLKFQTARADRMVITAAGNVGIGTTSPAQALEVAGQVKIDTFASASATAVCQNANVLSSCSSSIRYKENIKDANFGLNEVMKMRPVTFKWKGRDEHDLGFVAEEMEKIDPLFVTYKDGQIEGVKYPQLTAVLASAVKELKSANDNQAKTIAVLQGEVSDLQRTVASVQKLLKLSSIGSSRQLATNAPHAERGTRICDTGQTPCHRNAQHAQLAQVDVEE